MPDKALPVRRLSGIRVHTTRQARDPPRTPPHEGDGPDEYPRPCHGDGEPACSARAACTEEAVQAYGHGQACGHGHAAAAARAWRSQPVADVRAAMPFICCRRFPQAMDV